MKNKLTKALVITLGISILLAGCASKENDRTINPVYGSSESSELNEGLIEFSFDIFKEVSKEYAEENVFISPYSISQALGMTYNGAVGETSIEMAEALGVSGLDDTTINEGNKYLFKHINDLSGVDLSTFNAMWYRDGLEIKPEFIDTNIEVFDAYVEEMDFNKSSAPSKMNKWIAERTNGLINDMIEDPIDKQSQVILANTVNFYGQWLHDFEERKNRNMMFNNSDGSQTSMVFMSQGVNLLYAEQSEFRMVQLPYEGKTVSMYCILPEGDTYLSEIVESLDKDVWSSMKNELLLTDDVILQLPKFKYESEIIDLNGPLMNLGMVEAFGDVVADFSDISDGLYISSIRHKAIIEIDETGTEAVAATVEEMKEEEMKEIIPLFIADRPFVIIIEDHETETILFIGKLEKF